MTLLTKQQILTCEDNKRETVAVPEWGGDVIVGTMTGEARDRLEASIMGTGGKQNLANVRAKYVAACLIDEDGNLLFSEKDIAALGRKSAAALDRIAEVAQRLNRVSDADIEELAKN